MRVYLFSPIPYSFLHQRPQKIADELRRQAIPVTFVEPYGLTEFLGGRKTIRFRDIFVSIFYHVLAVAGIIFRRNPPVPSLHIKDDPGPFEILTLPLVIPSNRLNSRLLDRLNAAICRAWLCRNIIGREGCRERDVALVQQPYFGAVLQKGDFARLYYDSLDDLSIFSGHGSRARLMEFEDTLLRMADSVFVTSESLEQDLRRRHPGLSAIRIPNGVDYDRFQQLAATSSPPQDVGPVTGRVAGYVGILRSWFDAHLLEHLALRNPEMTFVLVGPYEETAEIRRLKGLRNIRLTGRKPYEQVPSYIQSFDVCLIPFRQNEVAEATNPVKVFEYFALGKPVVSTWLRELVHYQEQGLLSMVRTDDEFEQSLHLLVKEDDAKKKEMRRLVARDNSWERHTQRMITVMQGPRLTP